MSGLPTNTTVHAELDANARPITPGRIGNIIIRVDPNVPRDQIWVVNRQDS